MEIEINKNTKLAVIFDAIANDRKCKLVVESEPEKDDGFWSTVKHFNREEFGCKCGRYCNGFPAEPSETLVKALDDIREYSGNAVIISSGVRCKTHNKNVGGVGNSYHTKGRAADFTICGATAATAINIVKMLGLKPIELYAIDNAYVHIAF